MGYFPFFVDIKDKRGLVVGGGKVAAHKVEKLLPFEPKLTVVSPFILPQLLENAKLKCEQRGFRDSDLEGTVFVIAASDDEKLNAHISTLCKEKGILVNVVDDKEKCGFLFPSLVKEGALTVGISTEGASPQVAAELRSRVAAGLPDQTEEILDYLAELREPAKQRIPDVDKRRAFLKETAQLCMEKNRGLTEKETEEQFVRYENHEKRKAGVTLVGAGCGAYDLITVRGLRALRSAQILVYDDLIDERLLTHVSESCEQIYVGKRDGKHSMKQEDINALLIEKAKTGKRVVRLKGGDSFVFGRGGEEILALQKEKIPTTVVPGISSCLAVPGEAGIPVTHRGMSRSFHVITGHTTATADGMPLDKDIKALTELDGTCIFLMGFHHLKKIADKLIAFGKSPQTPVAVIHGKLGTEKNAAGTIDYPEASAVRGTLENIADKVKNSDIKSPAVIVIGETAGLELI